MNIGAAVVFIVIVQTAVPAVVAAIALAVIRRRRRRGGRDFGWASALVYLLVGGLVGALAGLVLLLATSRGWLMLVAREPSRLQSALPLISLECEMGAAGGLVVSAAFSIVDTVKYRGRRRVQRMDD